jgi:hypothetical protein
VLCPVCHGKGLVEGAPCQECGGLGLLHCCEGLVEQPAPEAAAGAPEAGSGVGPPAAGPTGPAGEGPAGPSGRKGGP